MESLFSKTKLFKTPEPSQVRQARLYQPRCPGTKCLNCNMNILWMASKKKKNGAIALSYPPHYCYWWLIMKKRGWKLYRSPNPNHRGVRKCNSAEKIRGESYKRDCFGLNLFGFKLSSSEVLSSFKVGGRWRRLKKCFFPEKICITNCLA